MRITQWGEYGMLFAAHIANRARAGAPTVSAAELAESRGITLNYAQQILLRLRDGGVVDSVRGPGGGYRLAREETQITLKEILIAMEGETFALRCGVNPLDKRCSQPDGHCCLQPNLRGLQKLIDTYLMSINLMDLLEGEDGL